MTKFILAAILAVLAVTYKASPAEACPGRGAAAVHRTRLAVRSVLCTVREPFRLRAVYVVPAFVAPVPAAVPTPMAKTVPADLEARVARLEKNTADAGRALLFGANSPSAKAAPVTVRTVPASNCPPGGCPAQARVPLLLWRR